MYQIEIYSRPGCHLCEVMIKTVKECITESSINAEIKIINIDTDKKFEKFKEKIPVMFIEGKMFAKYETEKKKLLAKLLKMK